MKKKNISATLSRLRTAESKEEMKIQLLLGIYELMIAIAERLDVIEDEEED